MSLVVALCQLRQIKGKPIDREFPGFFGAFVWLSAKERTVTLRHFTILYLFWQMEFLGHVCRRRGLEFLSLTGKVEGKRDSGKQRITFLDSLCNSATGGQSKGLNFLKLSDDRDVWRGMAANVCSRSGT